MAKKEKKPLNPVERAIKLRERGIERMEQAKVRARERADAEIAAIDKRIAEKKVILEAWKQGVIHD